MIIAIVYCMFIRGEKRKIIVLNQINNIQTTILLLIQILFQEQSSSQRKSRINKYYKYNEPDGLLTFISIQFDQYKQQMEKKADGNIKVFCRFRPFNSKQLAVNPQRVHRISNSNRQLIIKDAKAEEISFMYDHVFDIDSTQEDVFQKVGSPVLNNIIDGFHGTIMAYGQTSSGKTHTMQGYDLNEKENRGIMPRMIQRLFAAIDKSPQSVEFKLKISIFELYMEKIRDLLDVSKNDLKIRQNKQGCYVQNLTEVYISDKHQLFRIITHGQKNRSTCATNMNQHSSRSHLIFLLSVNQFNNLQSSSKTSKLFLIDLAGSEKISKTGAEGKVLEQAKKINLSLTNLGKVIKALSERTDKGGHVPYRDSKLTRILKDSLGGNSKTTLIVTCSPHEMHISQSISTLRFGENAQKVKNKPKINRQLTVQELQKIIQKLEIDVSQRENRIKVLQNHIKTTLKAQLPKQTSLKLPVKSTQTEIESNEIENQQQSQSCQTVQSNAQINEQSQQRIKALQAQLQSFQSKMKNEMDKYYQLKKQYNQLHDNLTSILKDNMELQEQLEDKKKKSLLSDKSISNNAHLIRLIVGEIFNFVEKDKVTEIQKELEHSHWYQKIMLEGTSCSEFWQAQKDEMNRQLEELMNQSKNYENLQDSSRKKEENRSLKDNEKILQLQSKFDELFQEYNNMMDLQTTWKAECQLYERKLKKKEQTIQDLEKRLQELSDQMEEFGMYDDKEDDTISVRSNKIVKPIKGGFIFR